MRSRASGALLFTFLGAGTATAADLTGTWLISGQVSPECSFTQAGDSLQGSCKGSNAQGSVTGSVSGQDVKWTYNWTDYGNKKPGSFEFNGTMDGDKIAGTVNLNGTSRPFTAKRQTASVSQQLAALVLAQAPSAPAAPVPGAPPGDIDSKPTRTEARITRSALSSPEPLVRLSTGDICDRFPGPQFAKMPGGRVVFDYVVDAEGSVASVNQVGGSGNPFLDGFAERCIRTWRFEPLSLTGAPAPFAARAAATFTFRNAAGKRLADMQWDAPRTREASDVAINAAAVVAFKCLQSNPTVTALAKANAGTTALRLIIRHGEISDAEVSTSSGSRDLDRAAVACYQSIPHDDQLAQMMDRLSDANVSLRWQILFPGQ